MSTAPLPATFVVHPTSGRKRQTWELPVHQALLLQFLTEVFTRYWDQIIYGPLIDGASYELVCPHAPTSIDFESEFLTIRFGHNHFHLCLGPTEPLEPSAAKPYHPKTARIFRQLDAYDAPISWGFEMFNQTDQAMLTIFFGSPFALPGDTLLVCPQWERLAMWRDISQRYLGLAPDAFDERGIGFVDGNF